MTGRGDQLARGAAKASWGPIAVSQAKWDSIWKEEESTPSQEPAYHKPSELSRNKRYAR